MKRWTGWLGALLVVGATSAAWAQTPQAAIAEARSLAASRRYSEAMTRFRDALAVDPSDGVTRCELGFTAYLAGDLSVAEVELDQGLADLAATSLNNARGACLYNRGRVAEDRLQLLDAERYYQESLVLRPGNPSVETRLATVRSALASSIPSPPPAIAASPAVSAGSPPAAAAPASPPAVAGAPGQIRSLPEDTAPRVAVPPAKSGGAWRWSGARALLLGVGVTAGGAGVVFLLAFVVAFVAARGRQLEEVELIRRVARAHRAVEAETEALGSAFGHVVEASRGLETRAGHIFAQVRALRAAFRRTSRISTATTGGGAASRRGDIANEIHAALGRLEAVAARLEETAVRLAAQRAGQGRPGDVERLMHAIVGETEIALEAEEEACAVVDAGAEQRARIGTSGREEAARIAVAAVGVVIVVATAVICIASAPDPVIAAAEPIEVVDEECPAGRTSVPGGCLDPETPGPWVVMEPAPFFMGTAAGDPGWEPDEVQHQVKLSHYFLIGAAEVSRCAYEQVLDSVRPIGRCELDRQVPVSDVSWYEAAAYCNVLSRREGLQECYSCATSLGERNCVPSVEPYECTGYRLPTEAEWEHVARAATSGSEPGGGNVAGVFGLADLIGEWCHDWYGAYAEGDAVDPSGPAMGEHRVIRGATWGQGTAPPRAADRTAAHPDERWGYVGFRVARTLRRHDPQR